MKTKTYVLTLSVRFPKGHPRVWEETEFADKVRRGLHYEGHPGYDSPLPSKIHTIRANYELWKRRIDEVNAGGAVLSVREWLGAPRRSKQREIFRFDRDSGIGVENLHWRSDRPNPCVYREIGTYKTEDVCVEVSALAANNGLTLKDWLAWFKDYDRTQPMAIIHFTSFRYCK